MEALLKILKRDRVARRIDVECPNCERPVPLGPPSVTKLEKGTGIVGWCPECAWTLDISVAAIGGYVWSKLAMWTMLSWSLMPAP